MTFPEMFTRDELIQGLLEHGSECADWVYLTAAVLLFDDGRRMREMHGGDTGFDVVQKQEQAPAEIIA